MVQEGGFAALQGGGLGAVVAEHREESLFDFLFFKCRKDLSKNKIVEVVKTSFNLIGTSLLRQLSCLFVDVSDSQRLQGELLESTAEHRCFKGQQDEVGSTILARSASSADAVDVGVGAGGDAWKRTECKVSALGLPDGHSHEQLALT